MPSAGTLKNLTVWSSAGSGFTSVSYAIQAQVWINGTLTSVSCTFPAGSSCTDSGNTHIVNAGDRVAVVLNFVSGTPVPVAALSVHASLEKQ